LVPSTPALRTALLLTNLPPGHMPSAHACASSLPHDTACDSAEGTTGRRRRFWALRLLALDSPPLDQPTWPYASARHAGSSLPHDTACDSAEAQQDRKWASTLGPSSTDRAYGAASSRRHRHLRLLGAWTCPHSRSAPAAYGHALHAACGLTATRHACDSAEGTASDAKEILGPSTTPWAWTSFSLTNPPSAICPQRSMRPLHCHTTQHVTAEGTTRRAKEILAPSDYLRLDDPPLDQPASGHMPSAASMTHCTRHRHVTVPEGTTRQQRDLGPSTPALGRALLSPNLPPGHMPSRGMHGTFTATRHGM